ncbi:kinase-like domain-containing protein [Bisporella sp. PMI_857]|nr:kinase-like domain-containing protein [Bisporella sp. PMI_857]
MSRLFKAVRLAILKSFPASGFVVLDATKKIEEEDVPSYVPEDYYTVYIGEVFRSRYQVVTKLGFGVNSTVWLCRDLNIVRRALDSFEIAGPNGNHKHMLYQPLGMSFTKYPKLLPQNRFPKDLTQRSVQLLLIALNYLHQCHIIDDDSIISQIENAEPKQPIARKALNDRTIYNSRPTPLSTGPPVLCDLGEASVGTQRHKGDIMPGIYRAPEVILGMVWDSKVDIWVIGVMTWDLLEGGHLFFAKKNRVLDDEQHLAEMVSLLGPPPPEFLKRRNWKGSVPIPDQSFEIRKQLLLGEDRAVFVRFLRRMLCRMPEERPVAEELAFDEFLMQPHATSICLYT